MEFKSAYANIAMHNCTGAGFVASGATPNELISTGQCDELEFSTIL